ncbi:MAG: Flp family type IVb pilin [Armatimonadota bacterium]|nr:Flp family type IVb pilin [bacterium]
MVNKIKSFLKDEEGATMVEYALMVALIACAAMGAVYTLGGKINTKFGDVNTQMDTP